MKQICFIMPGMPGGGAERVVTVLCEYFVSQGYSVRLCLVSKNIIEYKINEKVKIDTSFIKNKTGISRILCRLHDLRVLLKKEKNTVFISFDSMISLYVLLANLGLKRRVIVSERNDPRVSIVNMKWLFALRRHLYKKASNIVFQTPGAMHYFDSKIQKKGVVILNPIKDGLPKWDGTEREKVVVTFSRLNKQKNIPLLLDAFDLFRKQHPDYKLLIYGQGEEEEKLKHKVEQLQLQKYVQFRGFCNDLHLRIINCRMFVLASDYEGLSNSMLEAMAIGLPCICTDCPPGGARMLINNNENGILTEVGNVNQMYEAMRKIAEDDEFAAKLSNNAKKIREALEKDRICKQWEALL